MRILCLDIEDSILPSNNTYFGQTDDNFEMLELNLKRIKMMIEKYDMKVFITSSMYTEFELNSNGEICLKSYEHIEKKAYLISTLNILSKYLNGNIIGISSGNRFRDIKTILEHGHTVVAIDDTDLSEIVHDKFLFVETMGFITNNLTYQINSFMVNTIDSEIEKEKVLELKVPTTNK